ncbi:polysaccharide deacetylase family protein [Streptomyces sp. TLI_171]|uniref:polysaccharide deacetylase family protein n=1 Tax=Streptomyces sp. TLI_171 TaxID=1938859 RepID=UPI000C198F80|nr:polysaccharide deacetylase family protein [Streptomyces sp. TLI_171]RKE17662.1 peptidoglycan/xylan/chitin deacetylase (PgdA/CDA1 family) [Streptomyces sp. TLI_171]
MPTLLARTAHPHRPGRARRPHHPRRRNLAALAALATLAVGCSSVRTEDLNPPAGPQPTHAAPPAAAPAAAPAALPQAAARQEMNGRLGREEQELTLQQAVATARRWGLAALPLKAPAPPAVKPELAEGPGVKRSPGLPPVVYRVPTTDNVVFLTVDDGAEKDPRFAAMAAELGVPMSAFLSDYLARSDYGYFRTMRDRGVALNNHTLTHPDLRRLGPDALQHEICGQQDRLQQETGARPRLFRPPYGEYTDAALRTAASCGITAVPLWNEEAFPDRVEYRYADQKLHPGDIVLTHFRAPSADWKGDMPDMLRRVVDTATAQGFAIARLEDYL